MFFVPWPSGISGAAERPVSKAVHPPQWHRARGGMGTAREPHVEDRRQERWKKGEIRVTSVGSLSDFIWHCDMWPGQSQQSPAWPPPLRSPPPLPRALGSWHQVGPAPPVLSPAGPTGQRWAPCLLANLRQACGSHSRWPGAQEAAGSLALGLVGRPCAVPGSCFFSGEDRPLAARGCPPLPVPAGAHATPPPHCPLTGGTAQVLSMAS